MMKLNAVTGRSSRTEIHVARPASDEETQPLQNRKLIEPADISKIIAEEYPLNVLPKPAAEYNQRGDCDDQSTPQSDPFHDSR